MVNPSQNNVFKYKLISGKQKKDPSKTFTGVSCELIIDGVKYAPLKADGSRGLLWPVREQKTDDMTSIEL